VDDEKTVAWGGKAEQGRGKPCEVWGGSKHHKTKNKNKRRNKKKRRDIWHCHGLEVNSEKKKFVTGEVDKWA